MMSDLKSDTPEIEQMAVPALPYWLSSAHSEYGTGGWISGALSAAGLPAPRWCSAMAGTSSWNNTLYIGKSSIIVDYYGYFEWSPGGVKDAGSMASYTTPQGRRIRSILCTLDFFDTGMYYISVAVWGGSRPSNGSVLGIEGLGTYTASTWTYAAPDSSFPEYYHTSFSVNVSVFNWFAARNGQGVRIKLINM